MLPCRFAPLLFVLLTAQSTPLQTFRNLNDTFHIDLPAGWRQLSPNEATTLGENPAAPLPLRFAQPRRYYAVGPVDDWLRGDFSSAWLQVVEQEQEWYVADDFAAQLTEMWRAEGELTGVHHELREIRREQVGNQKVEVVMARRTSTPKDAPATTSLDVHSPSGGQQVTLSFTCRPNEFDHWRPEFQRWLDTLVFARARHGNATLTSRLWGPLLTGGLISLALFLIYKHTRGRR